ERMSQPEHDEVPREWAREAPSIRRLQRQRDHVDAFAIDPRDPQRPESGRRGLPGRRGHETRVARGPRLGLLALEQLLERPPPARVERRDSKHPLELLARMVREIEQRTDLGDGHALGSSSNGEDQITRADLAFLEDAQIEARPPAGGQERCHLRLVETNPDAVARRSRLGHLEEGTRDAVTVANPGVVLRQYLGVAVLAEIAV